MRQPKVTSTGEVKMVEDVELTPAGSDKPISLEGDKFEALRDSIIELTKMVGSFAEEQKKLADKIEARVKAGRF